jgi:hypothetical protein
LICLSDNDVIYKLAACDLLEDAWGAIGLSPADVHVLPTAAYRFGIAKKSKKAEARFGAQVLARIEEFLAKVRTIDLEPPAEELSVLAGVDGIDSGEALLFAIGARDQSSRVLTGDKRSLRTLATEDSCRAIAKTLAGRILCVEQIVQVMIRHVGFEEVRNRVLPGVSCDTVLRAVFGSGQDAREAEVLAGLNSYLAELRSLPVDLLLLN